VLKHVVRRFTRIDPRRLAGLYRLPALAYRQDFLWIAIILLQNCHVKT